jgi:predicted esterase
MSSIRETQIQVNKTARFYTIGAAGPDTREVWLVCHGYGQLAQRFVARFDSIASAERVIIAPEGLHRFYLDPIDRSADERRVGATWMTRHPRDADIADYIAYLDQVCSSVLADSPNAQLLGFGFSQGTATITRWAAASTRQLTRLVLWGAGLPPDLDWSRAEARLQDVPVTLVVGRRDPFALPERIAEQEALLAAHGIAFDTVYYAGDHRVDPAVLRLIAAR